MIDAEPRPYEKCTDQELRGITLSLARRIESLQAQQEAMQQELLLRGMTDESINAQPPLAVLSLNYQTPQAVQAFSGLIGDSYADEARRYAMRFGMVVALVSLVAFIATLMLFKE